MDSLFAKVIMVLGALAASISIGFWNIAKGSFSLEILSTMTPVQGVGFAKMFAAITLIVLILLFVMFLARDRSND
jgi:glucan phosphoethanolaminetransferase (alkaline phosphatase superfamily)